jgi:hypothetical protein
LSDFFSDNAKKEADSAIHRAVVDGRTEGIEEALNDSKQTVH